MIQFLEDQKGRGAQPLSAKEKEELEKLRKQYAKIQLLKKIEEEEEKKAQGSDESSGVNIMGLILQEEQDNVGVLQAPVISQEKAKAMAKNSRTSVSAEAFGKYHKKEAFQAVVIKKSDSTKEK